MNTVTPSIAIADIMANVLKTAPELLGTDELEQVQSTLIDLEEKLGDGNQYISRREWLNIRSDSQLESRLNLTLSLKYSHSADALKSQLLRTLDSHFIESSSPATLSANVFILPHQMSSLEIDTFMDHQLAQLQNIAIPIDERLFYAEITRQYLVSSGFLTEAEEIAVEMRFMSLESIPNCAANTNPKNFVNGHNTVRIHDRDIDIFIESHDCYTQTSYKMIDVQSAVQFLETMEPNLLKLFDQLYFCDDNHNDALSDTISPDVFARAVIATRTIEFPARLNDSVGFPVSHLKAALYHEIGHHYYYQNTSIRWSIAALGDVVWPTDYTLVSDTQYASQTPRLKYEEDFADFFSSYFLLKNGDLDTLQLAKPELYYLLTCVKAVPDLHTLHKLFPRRSVLMDTIAHELDPLFMYVAETDTTTSPEPLFIPDPTTHHNSRWRAARIFGHTNDLTALHNAYPGSQSVRIALVKAYLAIAQNTQPSNAKDKAEVKSVLRLKIKACQLALKFDPGNAQIQELLIQNHLQAARNELSEERTPLSGPLQETAEHLLAVLELDPENTDAKLMIANDWSLQILTHPKSTGDL